MSGKRLEEVAVMADTTEGYGTWPVIYPRSSAVPQASRLMALEIEFDGLKVPVDLTALIYLPGTTLDFRDGLSDAFAFHNPEAWRMSGRELFRP
jgi:hypothetical protein